MAFVTMELKGFDELQKNFEALASDAEAAAVERKIVRQCRDIAAEKMKAKVPKSRDNSKSGKKGYRPGGHAADNVPVSGIRQQGGRPSATVGWEKADNEQYFYIKFVEWGTTKMQPRDFIYSTIKESFPEFDRIAEKEIKAFVESKIGGD